VTVTVSFATVTRAVRVTPELAATEMPSSPAPFPLLGDTDSHEADGVAVHEQPLIAVRRTDAVPPPEATCAESGLSPNRHGAPSCDRSIRESPAKIAVRRAVGVVFGVMR
jgi:hypothetical protein